MLLKHGDLDMLSGLLASSLIVSFVVVFFRLIFGYKRSDIQGWLVSLEFFF